MSASVIRLAALSLLACGVMVGSAKAVECQGIIVNVHGRADSQAAAHEVALENWTHTVTKAWGASFANYSLAQDKAVRCWKDGNMADCRVTGKPCKMVFTPGMKLKFPPAHKRSN